MKRRRLITHIRESCAVSERRACTTLNIHRSTYRYRSHRKPDESALHLAIIELARKYASYGYRMIAAMLRERGWRVNHKRVERIWREEGLKVPQKQRKRRHLWLNDGSCVRLRAAYRNHVWSYDFVLDRTMDGRTFRMLTVIDEYTRECLAIKVDRRLKSEDVIECLMYLFQRNGLPQYIRSDNGSEFTTARVQDWLKSLNVQPMFIEPGSPWENGYNESFNGTLRRELLAREIFDTLTEARILIERWRREYNTMRPHSSLGYRPPAPEAIVPFGDLMGKNVLEKPLSRVENCQLN